MYAVTLYIFHRFSDNFKALIFGYALDIGEAEAFSWHSLKINGNRRWELLGFRCVMANEDIYKFLEAFGSTGKSTIIGKLVQAPQWAVRPAIYFLGNGEQGKGIKSLTDRTCRGMVYYALEKTSFLERLFPPGNIRKEQVKDDINKLESWVSKDIGIKLFSVDSDRFGNMEVYDSLDSSSLLEPFGLHLTIIRETKTLPGRPWSKQPVSRGIKVWADEALAGRLPVWLNISLFNGRNDSETITADKLRQIKHVGEVAECEGLEPISSFKVKVWSEDGELIHYSHSHLMRSICIDMAMQAGKKRIRDPWSKKLPGKYQDKVENVEALSREVVNIGGYAFDPWIPEGDSFRQTLQSLFSTPSQDRFFEATQEGEVSFFDYLQSLLDRNEVRKVIFIDPFFGSEAAGRLLTRLKTTSQAIEVITSLVNKKVEGDTETPLKKMEQTLNRNRTLLPGQLKVINIQNKDATEQQFHDRFLLLETSDGREGWILGNSYHSQSQKYPAIMVKLQDDIINKIVQYYDNLLAGNITGRKEARQIILFESKGLGVVDDVGQELLPGGLKPFPGWEGITEFFSIQGMEPKDVLRQLIDSGYLESRQGLSTWRLVEDKLQSITIRVRDHINKLLTVEDYEARISDCFKCLAQWIYHGADFSIKDIVVIDERLKTLLTKILDELLEDTNRNINEKDRQWSQIKTVFEQFTEEIDSYERCLALYEHPYEFEYLLREKQFYAEYLWYADRKLYYEVLDNNFILLPHWLYVLYRRKDFGNYQLSKIATRFYLFSQLQFVFNHQDIAMHSDTRLDVPAANRIKLKSFFTYLGTLREEEQQKIITNTLPLFDKEDIEYGEILPFLQKMRQAVLVKFTDTIEPVEPELANAIRVSMIEIWTAKLKKEGSLFFNYSQDKPETEMMVDISASLYGGNWPEWYQQQFIEEFPWKRYKNPFQRFHQYSSWYSNSISLLWCLFVGLIYLEKHVQDVVDSSKHSKVLKEIINRFEQYVVPQVWHLPLGDVLLDEVLYLMGWLADKFEMREEIQKLSDIIDAPFVQLPRKLDIYLSSYQLFLAQKEKVLSILKSPTLLLWLHESSIKKLGWVANVFKNFSEQPLDDNKELVQTIQYQIISLLKEATKDPVEVLWKLDLSDPVKYPLQWNKWASILKVDSYQLKKIWHKQKSFDFFGKLLALGIYLFGDLNSFQTWLHQDIYGNGTSPWYRISRKQQDEVLEELFRKLVGVPF